MEGGRRAQADRAEVPRGESKAGGGRGEPKGYKTRLDCGAVSLNLPSPPVVPGTFCEIACAWLQEKRKKEALEVELAELKQAHEDQLTAHSELDEAHVMLRRQAIASRYDGALAGHFSVSLSAFWADVR